MQCVGGSREGTDGCVRERRFFFSFPPPWQRVALAKVLEFWEGDGGGALALKILGG